MTLITPQQTLIVGFTLTKFGSLKRKESKWFTDRDRQVMQGLVDILRIAQEMALANDIDPAEAYQIVSSYGSSAGSDLLVPYADRLAPLVSLLGLQESTPAAAVTMMLQSRLGASWLAENKGKLLDAYGIVIDGDKWQETYTEDLPEETIDLLWDFINNERNRWKEQPVAEELTVGEESASTPSSSNEMTMMSIGTEATGQFN